LDSSEGKIDDDQMTWLKGVVSETKNPVIIFSHQGIIESPKGVVWKKNLKNGKEIREFLKSQKNVLAVFSGNSSEGFVNKESGIPYVFVPGLTEKRKRGSFSEITISNKEENEYVLDVKIHFNEDFEEHQIKRFLFSKKQTKIDKLKDNEKLDKFEALWKDLDDKSNPKGVISEDKGTEVGMSSNEKGVIVSAFEDKKNDGKISVKMFENGAWSRVGKEKNGIVSLGKGSNPNVIATEKEIFVTFTELDYDERPRIVKWDGNSWSDLSGFGRQNGFLSGYPSMEPVVTFDRSGNDLYVAFGEKTDEMDYKVKLMKWDGRNWAVLSDKLNGYVTQNYSKEVDLAASSLSEHVVYLAYENTHHDNKIQVVRWDGSRFEVLRDERFKDGFVGNMKGYSPSLSVDGADNVFVTFSDSKPGTTYAFKWNGSAWEDLGENATVSAADTIESAIIVDENAKNIIVAYSEFRKNTFIERIVNEKSKFFNEGVWRLRARKFENGQWVDFGHQNSGYISFGDGKADPSMTITQGRLFITFTDEESDNKARVKYCDLEN
jgi:hypothetical protein